MFAGQKMSRDGLKSKLKYPEMNEAKKYFQWDKDCHKQNVGNLILK